MCLTISESNEIPADQHTEQSGATLAVRVLIVDDHPVVRAGIAAMVDSQVDLQVVGEAGSLVEAVAGYSQVKPDVVLMDLRMPHGDGVSASEKILDIDPQARIVVLTTFSTHNEIARAIQVGAKGYLLKDSPRSEVLRCIRLVGRGQTYLPQGVLARLEMRTQSAPLSSRELMVLRHVVEGKSNKEIARLTRITEATVKFHLTAVMAKLQAKSRTHAIYLAVKQGIVLLE